MQGNHHCLFFNIFRDVKASIAPSYVSKDRIFNWVLIDVWTLGKTKTPQLAPA